MFCVALWCPLIKISVINFCLSPSISFVLPGWSHTSPQTISTFQRRSLHWMRAPPSLTSNFQMYICKSLIRVYNAPYFARDPKRLYFLILLRVYWEGPASIPYQLSISIRAPTRHPSSLLLSPLSGSSQTKINQKLPADNYRSVWSTRVIFSLSILELNGLQFRAKLLRYGLRCQLKYWRKIIYPRKYSFLSNLLRPSFTRHKLSVIPAASEACM